MYLCPSYKRRADVTVNVVGTDTTSFFLHRFPKAKSTTQQLESLPVSVNLTADMLPQQLAKELNESIKQLHNGNFNGPMLLKAKLGYKCDV